MKALTIGQGGAKARNLSLDAIYREHGDAVTRWAARLGGTGIDLEDVVQEVFAIAAERLDAFRGDSSVSTWLLAITENVVRKQRRRAKVQRWFSGWLDFGPNGFGTTEEPHSAPVLIEQRQARELVERTLEQMREPYRSAMILFELEGLSGEEIAKLRGVKVGTVWVWLHRARAQFLRRVEEFTGPAPALPRLKHPSEEQP